MAEPIMAENKRNRTTDEELVYKVCNKHGKDWIVLYNSKLVIGCPFCDLWKENKNLKEIINERN